MLMQNVDLVLILLTFCTKLPALFLVCLENSLFTCHHIVISYLLYLVLHINIITHYHGLRKIAVAQQIGSTNGWHTVWGCKANPTCKRHPNKPLLCCWIIPFSDQLHIPTQLISSEYLLQTGGDIQWIMLELQMITILRSFINGAGNW